MREGKERGKGEHEDSAETELEGQEEGGGGGRRKNSRVNVWKKLRKGRRERRRYRKDDGGQHGPF